MIISAETKIIKPKMNFDLCHFDLLFINDKATKKYINKKFNTNKFECSLLRVIESSLEKVTLWLCKLKDTSFKFILVVCRGTEGIKAWLENIDIFPLKQKIMDGFYDGFLSIHKEVYQWLDFFSRKLDIDKIMYTGFSRGGATTQLLRYFASKTLGIGIRTLCTITFASPRVFQDGELRNKSKANVSASQYNKLDEEDKTYTLHYTQINDPVPCVPPTFLNYSRTGTNIVIGKKNKFLSKIPILRLFIYHPIRRYMRDLKKLEY